MRQEDIGQDGDQRLLAGLTGKIQTVTGLIDPEMLGVCLTHEHLLIDLSDLLPPPNTATASAFYARPVSAEAAAYCRNYSEFGTAHHALDSVETAVEELGLFKQYGGQAMVDLTLASIYRDPVGLQRISRAAGVHVVMGCGFYVAATHPPALSDWNEQQIAAMIVADIVEGAAAEEESRSTGKGVVYRKNTGVRAGVIGEIGCSSPLHDDERKGCVRPRGPNSKPVLVFSSTPVGKRPLRCRFLTNSDRLVPICGASSSRTSTARSSTGTRCRRSPRPGPTCRTTSLETTHPGFIPTIPRSIC